VIPLSGGLICLFVVEQLLQLLGGAVAVSGRADEPAELAQV